MPDDFNPSSRESPKPQKSGVKKKVVKKAPPSPKIKLDSGEERRRRFAKSSKKYVSGPIRSFYRITIGQRDVFEATCTYALFGIFSLLSLAGGIILFTSYVGGVLIFLLLLRFFYPERYVKPKR